MRLKVVKYVPAIEGNADGPELISFRCKCGYEFAYSISSLQNDSMQLRRFVCKCEREVSGALLRSLAEKFIREQKIVVHS